MLIDWFTVGAQIVNFLVLVGLLRLFLYKRIIDAMDRREQNIADRMQEAEDAREEALQTRQEFEDKRQELEKRAEERMKQAEEDAEARRKELIERARADVDQSRERWMRLVEEERKTFLEDLSQELRDAVFNTTLKALAEIANADLERQAVESFLHRFDRNDALRNDLAQSLQELRDDDKTLTVTTSFDLSSELRDRVRDALRGLPASDGVTITFETSPDLICGIEIKTTGHKAEWSLRKYVNELRERMATALEESTSDTESSVQSHETA